MNQLLSKYLSFGLIVVMVSISFAPTASYACGSAEEDCATAKQFCECGLSAAVSCFELGGILETPGEEGGLNYASQHSADLQFFNSGYATAGGLLAIAGGALVALPACLFATSSVVKSHLRGAPADQVMSDVELPMIPAAIVTPRNGR